MIRRASLTLLTILAAASAVRSEYVVFRNECQAPVVVQTASVVRGVLRRDQALVKPGEYTDQIPLDCDKLVTISDGRTGRVLFRDPLKASKTPLGFVILPDRGKVRTAPRTLSPAGTMRGP